MYLLSVILLTGERVNNTQKKTTKRPEKKEAPKSLIVENIDWNGSMFPFKGTAVLYQSEQESITEEFDDNEWIVEESNSKIPQQKSVVDEKEKPNNALTSLVSYDDSESDEGPTEVKTEKKVETAAMNCVEESSQCMRKENETGEHSGRVNNKGKPNRTKGKKREVPQRQFKKRRVTLLEKLLAKEIDHERNVLLQCVRHVVQNNFYTDLK